MHQSRARMHAGMHVAWWSEIVHALSKDMLACPTMRTYHNGNKDSTNVIVLSNCANLSSLSFIAISRFSFLSFSVFFFLCLSHLARYTKRNELDLKQDDLIEIDPEKNKMLATTVGVFRVDLKLIKNWNNNRLVRICSSVYTFACQNIIRLISPRICSSPGKCIPRVQFVAIGVDAGIGSVIRYHTNGILEIRTSCINIKFRRTWLAYDSYGNDTLECATDNACRSKSVWYFRNWRNLLV